MDFDRLSSRYVGPAAKRYDADAISRRSGIVSKPSLSTVLGRLKRNSTVVDIPVGTGRCFELYAAQGLCVTGLDISPDMLAEARSRAESVGLTVDLRRGDIRKIDAGDRAFETAVCIRFLNWIEMPDVEIAVRERSAWLGRTSSSPSVITCRRPDGSCRRPTRSAYRIRS